MDLETYFKRIGYRAEGGASRETLERLVLHHTETIPFENLSPLLGEEVRLDIESLEDKMVRRGRGGYCFEHNLLFWSVLRELGYEARGLGARVRWGFPSEVMTPRGHMLLLVTLGAERYVVDVGFGLLTLTAPVALVPDVEQRTPHGPVRIAAAGDCYELQARSEAQWRTVYLFDLSMTVPADYEMFNWFYATHPKSRFVNELLLARPAPGCRHALLGNRYTVRDLAGRGQSRVLGSAKELRHTLQDAFRLTLPQHPKLDERLRELVQAAG